METLLFIGVLIGLAVGIFATSYIFKQKKEKEVQRQSVLLLEKIKQVCKLITVEGEFSELFTHRDEKNLLFKLFQVEKKALLIVKARVMVGFDLTQIGIQIDSNNKRVTLSRFPEPQIISIDNDLEYYDVQKGLINKFSETDLNQMNKNSKEFIREKVKQSHLFSMAQNQASETVSVIRQIIESVDWELSAEELRLKE